MVHARWVYVCAVAPCVAACAIIVGIEERPLRPTPSDASLPDPCVHVVPPAKPDSQDDDEVHDFSVALRSIAYETPGRDLGFDLDDTCTCHPGPRTHHDGGASCLAAASSSSPCDADGGIDNAFAGTPFLQLPGADSATINDAVDCGDSGFVLEISGYNGRANDALIAVSFVPILGILAPHDAADTPATCRGSSRPDATYRPRWDGTDEWTPDGNFVVGSTPRVVLKGYVRDWTLVTEVGPDTKIPVPLGSYRAFVHMGLLVAAITPLDDQRVAIAKAPGARARNIALEGTLAGRLPVRDLLNELAHHRIAGKVSQCPGSELYPQIRDGLCSAADVTDDVGDDFGGKACSALSMGIHFRADPASLAKTAAFNDAGAPPCEAEPNPCAAR